MSSRSSESSTSSSASPPTDPRSTISGSRASTPNSAIGGVSTPHTAPSRWLQTVIESVSKV
ncbi:hypothetical protein sscle_09g070490 [Sclerotinia sclerotiorum 1980 UF-70]|uniref:Uncharacterized protein n=1 Tax=Sclerotinia sclerotiorum (strain ATCC 18683 / 1980 / Ss-1) TaxID=665079 RepID=A0A1D9QBL2_SCLS1|nr:hypothetical protein sscle_09g070490 [Sclerotinia sclerotiorum 1980 UF-70]